MNSEIFKQLLHKNQKTTTKLLQNEQQGLLPEEQTII